MGRAIAELFTTEDAHVAVTDRDGEGLSGKHTWELDISEAGTVERVVNEIVDQLGPIAILVTCAGIRARGNVPAISAPAPIAADDYWRAWDLTLAVNLSGYVRMIRACLPHLSRDVGGRIVNIASTEGLGATPFISPYTVSKHGVVGLTRSLACELGPL